MSTVGGNGAIHVVAQSYRGSKIEADHMFLLSVSTR